MRRDPVQAQQLSELLQEPLSRCPDPEMALANMARWTAHLASAASTFATLKEDPRLLDDLVFVFASSQYLADILIRDPTAYTLLMEPDEGWQSEDLRARLPAVIVPFSRPASRLEARPLARRRARLRPARRALTGRATFQTGIAEISSLARGRL